MLAAGLALGFCAAALAQDTAARVEFRPDPRLELAGVVETLAGSAPKEDPYRVRERFATWRTHSAVRRHRAAGFGAPPFSARVDILLRVSPPPELARSSPWPEPMAAALGGTGPAELWLDGLRSFCEQFSFLDFFSRESLSLLGPPAEALRAEFESAQYLGKIEAYAGLPFTGRYQVLVTPFLRQAEQRNMVDHSGPSPLVATVLGPRGRGLAAADFRDPDLPATYWHELGHGLLDPLSFPYADELERRDGRPGEPGCYGSWAQCLREHVAQGVMIRLLARERGRLAAWSESRDARKRLPFLKPFLRRLKDYEGNRDRYPSLAEFYPELLRALPP